MDRICKRILIGVLTILLCLGVIPSNAFSLFDVVKADALSDDKSNTLTLTMQITKDKELCDIAKNTFSLEGAEFTLYDESGNAVGKFITDASGVGHVGSLNGPTVMDNIPDGTFTLKNTVIAKGFKKVDDQSYMFKSAVQLPETITVETLTYLYGYDSSGSLFDNNQYILWRTDAGLGVFECGIDDVNAPSSIAPKASGWGSHTISTEDMKVLERDGSAKVELIYKILYYGNHGPEQWSGFSSSSTGRAPFPSRADYGASDYPMYSGTTETERRAAYITHAVLSEAWGKASASYRAQQAGVSAFRSYVNSAAAAPENFVVYWWDHYSKTGNQDMFFASEMPDVKYDHKAAAVDVIPEFDPISVMLTKEGNKEKVGGVQFTMKYYDGEYATFDAASANTPVRTWVFETKANGQLRYEDSFKVSGDDLFRNSDGMYVLLPGTYTLEETKVDTSKYVVSEPMLIKAADDIVLYTGDGKTVLSRSLSQETTDGYLLEETGTATVYVYKQSTDTEFEKDNPLTGAEYTFYTDEGCTTVAKVYDPDNSAPADAVVTISTDGYSNRIVVIPGQYWVKETKPAPNYELDETVYPLTAEGYAEIKADSKDAPSTGTLVITKKTTDTAYLEVHSLEGAEYTIYKNNDNGSLTGEVTKLKVKTNGTTDPYTLNVGTYYVKETGVPAGYELDEDIKTVTISRNENTPVESTDAPANGYVKVKKALSQDSELVEIARQYYSLEGTVFNIFTDAACTSLAKDVGGNDAVLTVDENNDTNTVELKAGIYWIKEMSTTDGYYLNDEPVEVNVVAGSEVKEVEIQNKPKFDIVDLLLLKLDEEDNPQKNVEFKVTYYTDQLDLAESESAEPVRSWTLKTDDQALTKGQLKFDNDHKVSGDELFIDADGNYVLLPGSYRFEETKPNTGYATCDPFVINLKIEDITGQKQAFNNPVVKDELQTIKLVLQKIDSETGEATPQGQGSFENAEFKVEYWNPLTSQWEDNGTMMTDAEGTAVKTGLKPGTYQLTEIVAPKGYLKLEEPFELKLGITEPLVREVVHQTEVKEDVTTVQIIKITVDEEGNTLPLKGATLLLKDSAGEVVEEWVTDGEPHVLKGLAVGETYTIREEKELEGYLPLEQDVTFTVEETAEVQSFTVYNEPKPEIHTTATSEDGDKILLGDKNQTIIDTVKLDKLSVGKKYQVKGQLVDAVDETKVLASAESEEFTATASSMEISIRFENVDLSEYVGQSVVVFEDLYKNGKAIATHHDLLDKDQTIDIPEAKTKAVDKADGDNVILNSGEQTIVDTVTYKNLTVGNIYKFKATLVNENGEPFKDENGNQITGERNIMINEPSGEVDVEIRFDGKLLEGETIVVFEDVYKNNKLVAVHHDVNDKDQTVVVPEVRTTASIITDGEKSDNTFSITDVVEYKNLEVGKEYTVKGILMEQDEEGNEKALLDKDGKEIVSETTFVAPSKEGKTEVTFKVEGYKAANKKTVVFETLYEGENKVAIHADINDENQTVIIPGLNFWVAVVKADAADETKLLKNCEITIFNADGTIAKDVNGNDAVGITDGKGNIVFELFWSEEGYYAKETKAPLGYRMNENKFEVKLAEDYDYAESNPIIIHVNDEAAPAVNTGDNSNLYGYMTMLLVSDACLIAVLAYIKNKRFSINA
ncbi:MAG: VaFE repeat-containing surface-anchored protein [Erysipelotrichaceae bacterium]|nr:VaFE repeat-containing surface-anchored protein [Erysipelotrichaceae bacterium]